MTNIIYLIKSPSNKYYIGLTSKTFEIRFKQHVKDAFRGSQFRLHKAIRKYGKSNFTHEILGSFSPEELATKEKEFIKIYLEKYGPENLYNMTLGGEGAILYTEEEMFNALKKFNNNRKLAAEYIGCDRGTMNDFAILHKIPASNIDNKLNKPKKVLVFDNNKNFLFESNSVNELTKIYSEGAIRRSLSSTKHSAKGHYFRIKANDSLVYDDHPDFVKESSHDTTPLEAIVIETGEVEFYDKKSDAIKFLNNNGIAKGNCASINKCISGEQKSAYGRIWKRAT